jgi:hypothetical protein
MKASRSSLSDIDRSEWTMMMPPRQEPRSTRQIGGNTVDGEEKEREGEGRGGGLDEGRMLRGEKLRERDERRQRRRE